MSNKEFVRLNFDEIRNTKTEFLESHHTIVIATSHDDKVTARTVTYATEGLDSYFMSWNHHQKILQIKENPNVALARDNL